MTKMNFIRIEKPSLTKLKSPPSLYELALVPSMQSNSDSLAELPQKLQEDVMILKNAPGTYRNDQFQFKIQKEESSEGEEHGEFRKYFKYHLGITIPSLLPEG